MRRREGERIGRLVPGYHNAFETDAAVDAGIRVWRELLAASRTQATEQPSVLRAETGSRQ